MRCMFGRFRWKIGQRRASKPRDGGEGSEITARSGAGEREEKESSTRREKMPESRQASRLELPHIGSRRLPRLCQSPISKESDDSRYQAREPDRAKARQALWAAMQGQQQMQARCFSAFTGDGRPTRNERIQNQGGEHQKEIKGNSGAGGPGARCQDAGHFDVAEAETLRLSQTRSS